MTLLVAGAGLLAVIVVDLVWTTLAPAMGGGPLTTRLGRAAWWLATRRPDHRRLQLTGYGVLLTVLLMWVGTMWMGWALVFLSHDGAVTDAATGAPADAVARFAFAAGAVTGAGAGYTAGSGPWQLTNNVAALLGLGVFTLAVTYVFQVVSATSHKRAVAQSIAGLGDSPVAIVVAGGGEQSLGSVGQQLSSLSVDLALVARQHRSLPVLHYLHAPVRSAAIELAVARLDEAMAIGECSGVTLGLTRPLRRTVSDFLDSVPVSVDAPPPPPPAVADDETAPLVHAAATATADRRARLHGLVRQNAWAWSDVDRA